MKKSRQSNMSSPELERFEITEEDLYPFPKRKRMSKNKAALGIFADSDEEDEDERPKRSGRKGPKDYFAPVSFVSGGIKVGDKVTKDDADDALTDSDEDEAVQVRQAAVKKAFGGPRKGPKQPKEDAPLKVGNKIMKMMESMGHVPGKGLGKNLHGIATPVKAGLRLGRGAIGFYGPENPDGTKKEPAKDSDEEEEKEFKQKLQRWKKGDAEQKKKTKYVTAEELLANSGTSSKPRHNESEMTNVKVIDMTGKEQRVLSGYHALSTKHDKPRDDDGQVKGQEQLFNLPELLHNLDILVKLSGEEIERNGKSLRYENDMQVNLQHEHENLEKVCNEEEIQIARFKKVIDIIEECEKSRSQGGIESLKICANLFVRLQKEYYVEYAMYDLSSVAVAVVFPLVKSVYEGWKPLENPQRGVEMMREWKNILASDNQLSYNQGLTSGKAMQPYDRLIWEILMPYLRSTILNTWNVRRPIALIDFLEIWRSLIPEWMMANILEKFVLPKLQVEVDNWNPLTDTMPIHTWIHPWLPLTGDQLEPIYVPIRQKLASALTKWHPSDQSARMILQPWVGVFNPSHMNVFLLKNIVPKLALCLQEFIINPHQQQLEAWQWVMSWLDIISPINMVKTIVDNFFPKWMRVLSTWLSSSPNFDDVTKWYLGWKSMFPDRLLSDVAIKNCLNEALELMNRAVVEHSQPGARENVAYLTLTERRKDFESDRRDIPEAGQSMASFNFSSIPSTVKEHIEQRAQELGLLFMPISNKTHDGRPVYKLGRLQITIDNTLINYFENGQWNMTSSVDLIMNKAE